MNRRRHTPAPWHVSWDTHAQPESVVNSYAGRRICGVTAKEIAEEETANARLIAAAPDLLEALDHNYQTVHRAHHEGQLETCPKETCQRALAAIRKAEPLGSADL